MSKEKTKTISNGQYYEDRIFDILKQKKSPFKRGDKTRIWKQLLSEGFQISYSLCWATIDLLKDKVV